MQSPRALLHDGMRRTLHETVFAPFVGHLAHHGVQPHGVGRGVGRLDDAFADFVDDRRDQPGLVAQCPHKVVEQCHGRGLAVGAGDAYELQLAARVAVEGRGHVGQRSRGVGDDDVGYSCGQFGGQLFADDGCGTPPDGGGDEIVPVGLCAARGEETVALRDGARIVGKGGHRRRAVAVQCRDWRIFE